MTKVGRIDSFAHTFVDACVKEAISGRVGFVNAECTFVKTLLKGIAYNALISNHIFTDETNTNLDNILNRLTYE